MSRPPHSDARSTAGRRGAIAVAIGLGATLATLAASAGGLLSRFEWTLFDLRARWFSHYTPPPSPDIVHINIDDASLERTGRWPWHREKLAAVVDELHRAGASVIAFDLLFSEPQEPRYRPLHPGQATSEAQRVDDDARLAEAIRSAGNVLLAVHAPEDTATGPISRAVIELLKRDPNRSADDVIASLDTTGESAAYIRASFASLRQRAIRERLAEMLAERGELPPVDACRRILLSSIPDIITASPLFDELAEEHAKVLAAAEVRRSAIDAGGPNDKVTLEPPILLLAGAANRFGIVNYESDADGLVRSVPLWTTIDSRRYPHLGLAAACQQLGISLDDVEVTGQATVLHNISDGKGRTRAIEIPTIAGRSEDGRRYADERVYVSWPTSTSHWRLLYDPAGQETRQMFPIGPLVEAAQVRRDLADNEAAADQAFAALADEGLIDAGRADEYAELQRALADGAATPPAEHQQLLERRDAVRRFAIEQGEFVRADFERLTELTPDEQDLRDRITTALVALTAATEEARKGRAVIADFERRARQFRGKVCIIGWTATGSIADFIPTSLSERTPGPIVHGAVLNAILTDHFIGRGPAWLDWVAIIGMGGIATLIAARFAPISALLIVAAIIGTGFIANGVLLFDYLNVHVAAAAPIVAAALSWAAVTVYRLVLEQRERARITRQFKNYVSGDLVDLIVEDPSRIKQGRHELTCMFSDIAGFTTVSEKLGPEQTIALLNEYLRAMTQRIMAGRGTVNKYLGDGIMAFWGAPIDDETHALNCCRSVLQCIHAMRELQNQPKFEGMPRLFMRVGVCTGPMMVGDCGAPPDRSDYTVIGDSVNLASRLESSNKQFDTQILLSERTHALVADHVVARRIGRIRVVGKAEFETVYELLAERGKETEADRERTAMTDAAVAAFIEARFQDAVERFDALADRFGRTKLIELYMELCRQYLRDGKPDDFRGELVLTQK